jgi:hypothetical protein
MRVKASAGGHEAGAFEGLLIRKLVWWSESIEVLGLFSLKLCFLGLGH